MGLGLVVGVGGVGLGLGLVLGLGLGLGLEPGLGLGPLRRHLLQLGLEVHLAGLQLVDLALLLLQQHLLIELPPLRLVRGRVGKG